VCYSTRFEFEFNADDRAVTVPMSDE
jgi:hypothetical protein